jgi:hypothetical protein
MKFQIHVWPIARGLRRSSSSPRKLRDCAILPTDQHTTQDVSEPIASHPPLDPPDVGAIIHPEVRIIPVCDHQASTQTTQSALTLGSVISTDSGKRRIQHPIRCVALETQSAGNRIHNLAVGSSENRPEVSVARRLHARPN